MGGQLQPVEAGSESSLVEAVYEAILAAILGGRLAPDSVLSEVSLARQMQVSRTPVEHQYMLSAKQSIFSARTVDPAHWNVAFATTANCKHIASAVFRICPP